MEMSNNYFLEQFLPIINKKAFWICTCTFILTLIFSLSPAAAQTWNVSVNNETPSFNNVTNVSNISSQINDGDIIRIWGEEEHTYEGGFTINKSNVQITRWEGSPALPLITNTSYDTPVITIIADNVTLRGLNISGNSLSSENGAGVHANGSTGSPLQSFNIIDCAFTDNTVESSYNGGAVYLSYVDNSIISNTTFENNTAEDGGGTYFYSSNNPALANTSFTNNTATNSGGGAYFGSSDSASLTNITFTNNTGNGINGGQYGGGGAYFDTNSANAIITDTTFTNNTVIDYGGGAYFRSDNTSLTNTTFKNNKADRGGGISVYSTSPSTHINAILTNTTFENNTATTNGGGAHFRDCEYVVLTNTTFENNTATGTSTVVERGYGGGAYFRSSPYSGLTSTTFVNNTAANYGGGAAFRSSSDPALTSTTFVNNTAYDGGGAWFLSGTNAALTSTTFVNNTAANYGGGACFITSDNVIIKNCFFENENNLYASDYSSASLNEDNPILGTNIVGGPYLGGNTWLRDPAQNISEWGTDATFDGICDQSLTINNFGTDHYPLVYGGTVNITSVPSGAAIKIDGNDTVNTTNTSFYLSVGNHTFSLHKEYFYPWEGNIIVVFGQDANVNATLIHELAPTLEVNQTEGFAPLEVEINVSCAGGEPEAWNLSLGNGTWINGTKSSEINRTVTYEKAGKYILNLTVSKNGVFNETNKTITVKMPAPTLTVSPEEGTAPLAVQINVSGAGKPDTWNLSLGNGTWINETNSDDINKTITYEQAGEYTLTLNVSANGFFNQSSKNVKVTSISSSSP